MLRLALLLCLVQLSVGDVVTGRVVMNGNPDGSTSLPPGTRIDILALDTSMADGPARELGRVQLTNVASLPASYSMTYTPDVSPSPHPPTLSARIVCPDRLCFITDHRISIPAPTDGTSQADIGVRAV